MKAMIFAAGLGTRLKPLTDKLPKALIPVCNRPLIEYVARKIGDSGINEVVVNVHYFADLIEQWIGEQSWITTDISECHDGNMFFEISDERELLLETGGAVLHAQKYLDGCGKFLIHNVDVFSDCDFKWFEEQVVDDALASLLVSHRITSRFLLFAPDNMRLVGWKNLSTGETNVISSDIDPEQCLPLAFSGIHIVSDKIFQVMHEYLMDKGIKYDSVNGTRFAIRDFYLWAAKKYPVYGVLAEPLEFIDVGKLDALKPAEDFVMRHNL